MEAGLLVSDALHWFDSCGLCESEAGLARAERTELERGPNADYPSMREVVSYASPHIYRWDLSGQYLPAYG